MPQSLVFSFHLNSNKQAAYSLLELTAIVLILSIMAAAVVPSFFASSSHKLDLVAEEIANALRFARSESLRTGEHYGATISQVTQTITIIKWDITTDPVSTELIPYHPVSKKTFQFNADGFSLAPGISINNSADIFNFDSIGKRRSVIFNQLGMPVWIMDSGNLIYRLLDSTIELTNGAEQRDITLAGITGRVTIQ